jgi:hypothetical protein
VGRNARLTSREVEVALVVVRQGHLATRSGLRRDTATAITRSVGDVGRVHNLIAHLTEPALPRTRSARPPRLRAGHGSPLVSTVRLMTDPGATTVLPRSASPFAVALTSFRTEGLRAASTRMLLACGATGVAGAGLLVGHRLGLGAAFVGLVVWAPALPALVRRRAVGDLLTVALSIALVVMVAVRDAGWVVGLCLATAGWAGAVAVTSARSTPAVMLSAVGWAGGVVRALRWTGRGAGTLVASRRRQVLVAVRSVAVTVVLLLVFGMLFASADAVFASYLPRADVTLLPAQVVVGILVALASATLAHLALAPPRWSEVRVRAGRPARLGEWLLPVLALDAMVLAFVLVQVGALLGGHRHVLETVGLTYAEYARQGFAQLVAATALTLVVVAFAARRAPRTSERDRRLSRAALGAMCVGTLGVVVSALRRMDLYVEAFGLTRLRLFVALVEVVMAAVLVLVMVAGVHWRSHWLPRAVVQVVAVAVLTLALVNPDAQILRHNTTADLGPALDVNYLQDLSADAVPAMAGLPEPLRSCLLARVQVDPPGGLADWNLGRDRAARVVAAEAELEPGNASACVEYGIRKY